MIRVFLDKNPLISGHAIRGMGAYTRNLLARLKNHKEIVLVETKKEADLIHYPYFDLFLHTLKVKRNEKVIVTTPDVIPLIYPKHYPPGLRGKLNLLLQKKELQKAIAIITISETSKKDIIRFLNIPQEKVFVTHLAPASHFKPITNHPSLIALQEKYGLPDHFVLYVGDVNYNKNLKHLAQASLIAKIPLVIVGKQAVEENINCNHPENQPFSLFLDKYGNNKNILRIGYVPDNELVAIYNLATVYCQPSFYEGFGIPVLEAMASGCPVVAAKTQALVEIGEGNCAFVDPNDPKDIARGLALAWKDGKVRRKLSRKGTTHAREFSWQKTADETVKIYKGILG